VTLILYRSLSAKHTKQIQISQYTVSRFPDLSNFLWSIWRINWQSDKISVCCKIFVLTSTYLLSNTQQKPLSTIDIISQNCPTSHLKPRHSDGHTVCTVHQCTTVDILWASVQTDRDKELGVNYLP